MGQHDFDVSVIDWPPPRAELEHRVRQAIASSRLSGFTGSEDTYHRVLNELSSISAAEIRARIADAVAYVRSTPYASNAPISYSAQLTAASTQPRAKRLWPDGPPARHQGR